MIILTLQLFITFLKNFLTRIQLLFFTIKTYEVKKQKFEIQIYYYDRENSEDEETTLYFSDKYGLLLLFNDGWLIIDGIFIYDEISKELVEMIINDSTNDFPSWRNQYLKKLLVPIAHDCHSRLSGHQEKELYI
jgi:hypothetical protein